MAKAIIFERPGGPNVLKYKDINVKKPGYGEALVENHVIGLNFIDTYHRSGLYPLPLPSGLGLEASGIVLAVGDGVSEVKVGDKVAYAGGPPGAYSSQRIIPAHRLVKVPAKIPHDIAAAMMLKGLTVWYLIKKVYQVQRGETVLFHAAAGGVGLIACQWLKSLGVKVIGTVGSDEKGKLAKKFGCAHTINYNSEKFKDRVLEITNGKKVPVVFDSVGKDTFSDSLDCLMPRGLMCVFGNGSGPVAPFDPNILAGKGSLYVTRPTLMTYTAQRKDLVEGAKEIFSVVGSNKVKIEIKQRYELRDAAQAHIDLESRKTTGSTVFKI
jgi:NADPH2:quinone reductase